MLSLRCFPAWTGGISMITKAEKDRLLAQAEEMVARAGGPDSAQRQFNMLVVKFQTAEGGFHTTFSRERARHWVAKAIRRARHPKRKGTVMDRCVQCGNPLDEDEGYHTCSGCGGVLCNKCAAVSTVCSKCASK